MTVYEYKGSTELRMRCVKKWAEYFGYELPWCDSPSARS